MYLLNTLALLHLTYFYFIGRRLSLSIFNLDLIRGVLVNGFLSKSCDLLHLLISLIEIR